MKLIEITPKELRCAASFCPAVYKSDRGTFVVIGKRLTASQTKKHLNGRVSAKEEAIEISRDFFSGIK